MHFHVTIMYQSSNPYGKKYENNTNRFLVNYICFVSTVSTLFTVIQHLHGLKRVK